MFCMQRPIGQRVLATLVVLLVLCTIQLSSSAELILPQTEYLYFQTNGAFAEDNNGDWWTRTTLGDTVQMFHILVPESVSPVFILTVDIFDPECFKTNNDLDEKNKRGAIQTWDSTYFKLVSPAGDTIADAVFAPNALTSESWQTLASFAVGDYGTGTYQLIPITEKDDENGFKLRIPDADPDGVPGSGDEISIAALRTSLQLSGSGDFSLRFHVDAAMDTLNIWNYDMDGPITLLYEFVDPSGNVFPGTVSHDALWNTGSADFPETSGDEFIDPEPGWWRVNISTQEWNQFIFYGLPFIDFEPDFPQLTIEKDDGLSDMAVNSNTTYLITIENIGSTLARHVTLRDTLPPELSYLSSVPPGVYDPVSRLVEWPLPDLAPAQQSQVELSCRLAQAPATGDSIINWAQVDYGDIYGNGFKPERDRDSNYFIPSAWIGDFVWIDKNHDGLQDAGEPGLQGVEVELLAADETILDSKSTNSDGQYEFADLAPGLYKLQFYLPAYYFFTAPDEGSDDTIDSDVDPASGKTALINAAPGQLLDMWDAGAIEKMVADLQVQKSVDREFVKIDELFTYMIKYVNLGPDTAKNVRLTDNLPPGVDYVSATIEPQIEPSALVWHFAALAPAEGGTITLQVRAGDITGGADNTVFISSPAHDPNIDDNSAAAQVHILVPIELSSFTARILNGNVVLEWITRSESNNAGFRLYRAAAREGNYELITPMLIRAAGNSSETNVYKYIDRQYSGERLWYKLADVDYEGKITYHEPVKVEEAVTPTIFEPIFPNPFNLQTTLRFSLRQAGHVRLEIYNTNGQLIKVLVNGQRIAGLHQVVWDGSNEQGDGVPSGTYISLFKVNGFERLQKMILLK
ncbi:DUF11 domain-containing protein [candidate division KSB1 bacterium]|nr:DUF11 domain-containing protein [candidate division KSB1 bacterium]